MKVRAIIDGQAKFGWYAQVTSTPTAMESNGVKRDFLFPITAYWYEELGDILIADAVVIPDISLCAVATGRKDKNGVEIYGSKGDMKGGDRVKADGSKCAVRVNWNDTNLQWGFPMATALGSWQPGELEILPPEGK